MTAWSLFGQPPTPATIVADTGSYTLAVEFSSSVAGPLAGIGFYSAPGAGALPDTIALFAVSGTSLVHSEAPSWSGAAGSGWVTALFSSPPSLTASTAYKAAVFYAGGANWYSLTAHDFDSGAHAGGVTNGPLSAPNNAGADVGQGSIHIGGSLAYPNNSFNASNYWADVRFVTSGSGLLMCGVI